ncbi:12989_t:CDS:2 [Ambispora leptoticha]|uniref:12989_t:CDS:1 n=1 Tax=Ambispora leptoticha TaxID=144679 RepID=A0A9N8VQW7_9GLOM|nr:12989_t:CDS:2 [Ambispora leptoticha]
MTENKIITFSQSNKIDDHEKQQQTSRNNNVNTIINMAERLSPQAHEEIYNSLPTSTNQRNHPHSSSRPSLISKISSAKSLSVPRDEQQSTSMTPEEITTSLKENVIEALKNPIVIAIVILAVIVIVVGGALILMELNLLTLSNEVQHAFWIEVLSQVLNAIFTLLTIVTVHSRLIPFRQALQLQYNIDGDNEEIKTERLRIIKKYVGWYDPEKDSMQLLLWVLGLINLNTVAQAVITCFLWGFSAYDGYGHIVFRTISSMHRPNSVLYCFVAVAILTSIVSGILILSRVTKHRQHPSPQHNHNSIDNTPVIVVNGDASSPITVVIPPEEISTTPY